eukprot:maker-scaffold813_size93791-snap-gene-0.2 protein:Tk00119 transcript:maker-scaffold813_size93791-snap-gene-0.2-mRNA-1 annotation:"methylcrotonoyl- carboxylase"
MDLKFNKNEDHNKLLFSDYQNLAETIKLGGGESKIKKQHDKGKLTARERIDLLLDPKAEQFEVGLLTGHEMYTEHGGCPSGGVVVKIGYIHKRQCIVVANDATVKAGAWFPITGKKNLRAQEIAMENHLPIVYLVDSAGVYLPMQDEIFPDKENFGRIFRNNAKMSAMGIPQIAAVMGSCVAGGAYLPIMSDEALIVKETGTIFLAGPYLVKAAIGENIDEQALGGADTHCDISGVTDYKAENDQDALLRIHNSEFDEYKAEYGQSLICGYARVDGWSVGIVANQRKLIKTATGEMQFGGVIYSDSADKATRFIANCNQKKIPLVFLQDVTGFMVGSKSEHGGIIKDGAKLVNAVSNSVVPKFTIVIGNSYGAGNYAMCGKAYDPRFMVAWPSARLAVMGGAQAAKVLLQIQESALKRKGEEITPEKKEKILSDIQAKYDAQTHPYYAAARLWVDGIIHPLKTRNWISMGIEAADNNPVMEKFNMGVIQT